MLRCPARIGERRRRRLSGHLAPMPVDVQRTLVTSLRVHQRRFVSVDPYLAVTDETLHDWQEVLADVDAFFPGEDELLLEGVRTNPERALPRLVSGRLRSVVFKRGARSAAPGRCEDGAFARGSGPPSWRDAGDHRHHRRERTK